MTLFAGEGLACVRGERCVFEGLRFALSDGGGLVLTGPNGSGKSSLLRLMSGLLRPAAGALTWDGEAVARDPEAHNARLHYVGHADAVKPAFTVAEDVAFWARLESGRADGGEDVAGALATFGMAGLAEVPARFLSAGQKRRVALARVVAAPAKLWLLDEPTTSLDAAAVQGLEAAIARHRREGGLVVAATHGGLAMEGAERLDLTAFAAGGGPL